MQIHDQVFSALGQLAVAVALGAIFYWAGRLSSRKRSASFLKYIGIQYARAQLDKQFLLVLLGVISFAVLSTILEFQFIEGFQELLTGNSSPYGRILTNGFSTSAILMGLTYCFIQAAGAEEILFRGLIAQSLFFRFGHLRGNIAQALIFWLVHLIILKLVTGEWISAIQFIGFVTSFGMGLLAGCVNFRRGGQSIFPSWLLHGCANFATFLTLAYLVQ